MPFAEQDTWALFDGASGSSITENDASGVLSLPQQAMGHWHAAVCIAVA